jgi:hypothetical protein
MDLRFCGDPPCAEVPSEANRPLIDLARDLRMALLLSVPSGRPDHTRIPAYTGKHVAKLGMLRRLDLATLGIGHTPNNCTIWTKYFRCTAYLRRGAHRKFFAMAARSVSRHPMEWRGYTFNPFGQGVCPPNRGVRAGMARAPILPPLPRRLQLSIPLAVKGDSYEAVSVRRYRLERREADGPPIDR